MRRGAVKTQFRGGYSKDRGVDEVKLNLKAERPEAELIFW